MRIIKVSATDSTNSFAKGLYRDDPQMAPFCVVAGDQLQGRGQRGTTWLSESGKNLTFSVVFPQLQILPKDQFILSGLAGLGVYGALFNLNVKNLLIKWPNDIMAAYKKIGGILIETFMGNDKITTCVIGIGINVNQQNFDGLPQASSLSLATEKFWDLDQLLKRILLNLEKVFLDLQSNQYEKIWNRYHQHLFKIGKPSTFQLKNGDYFVGTIQGVAPSGKLMVQVEDEQIKEFDIKEVKLCY